MQKACSVAQVTCCELLYLLSWVNQHDCDVIKTFCWGPPGSPFENHCPAAIVGLYTECIYFYNMIILQQFSLFFTV